MDYDARGHVFTVTLRQPVSNLKIEAFDPAQVVVGDTCTANNLAAAKTLAAANTVVTNPSVRYVPNAGGVVHRRHELRHTGLIKTEFIIRSPGTNPWDPTTWPIVNRCTEVSDLPSRTTATCPRSSISARPSTQPARTWQPNFRQWVTLCDFPGTTLAGHLRHPGAHQRPRAPTPRAATTGSGCAPPAPAPPTRTTSPSPGFGKMVHLRQHPRRRPHEVLPRPHPVVLQRPDLQRQPLRHRRRRHRGSTITVLPPSEVGGTFSGCKAKGVTTRQPHGLHDLGQLGRTTASGRRSACRSRCPTPATTPSATGCWVRLEFYYGSGSNPSDTTSWQASVEGDPIRLVE